MGGSAKALKKTHRTVLFKAKIVPYRGKKRTGKCIDTWLPHLIILFALEFSAVLQVRSSLRLAENSIAVSIVWNHNSLRQMKSMHRLFE